MSTKPTYTFLPWARLGVANSITQADNDASVKLRATVAVELDLQTESVGGAIQNQPVTHAIDLYGPSDIIGIDAKAIVRVEPTHWTTSFESNLLAYAEFHDPDFPWRYTPAAATEKRLRPWLAVVALTEEEFQDVKRPGRPLPAFQLADGAAASALFPDPDQLWAWAHVHVNESLTGSSLEQSFADDPDLATSRVLCARHLEANKTYHAFLIPAFEGGRLAGLGLEVPTDLTATKSAWAEGQTEFPYFHRWQFRTGFGDFEYLVRLLKPQPADPRVGVRDIDLMHTEPTLPPITKPELGGVLRLGGALQVPQDTLPDSTREEIRMFDEWDHPQPDEFQRALAALVDLADDYETRTPEDIDPDDPDPVVTSPMYGRWHALATRLLFDRDGNPLPNLHNWVHELNLDPRWRVAAAIGTEVIQRNQERYMKAAWEQVGDVLAANALLRQMQLARLAGTAAYQKHLVPLDPARRLQLTSPVQRRVLVDGITARHVVDRSTLPAAALAPTFRAMMRPRGPLATRTNLSQPGAMAQIVTRLDSGSLSAAKPFAPSGGITLGNAAKAAATTPAPAGQTIDAATRARVMNTLSAGLTQSTVAALPTTPLALARLGPTKLLAMHAGAPPATRPRAPISAPPMLTHLPVPQTGATALQSARFKTALTDAVALISMTAPVITKSKLHTETTASKIVTALHPQVTVAARFASLVKLPDRIQATQVRPFVPAMVYPVIDTPMYEPLAAMSSELFVPNLNLIPHNSITMLEQNERFIEAYMVGLNHEMSRELLWREYPTDQRGSYFRQFWDVSSVFPENPPPAAIREQFRDIPPIHTWSPTSTLRDHNQRVPDPGNPPVVLVIRGELLKRYPNTVLFALKAKWATDEHGHPDKSKERTLAYLDAAEQPHPPHDLVRTPLFEARVNPDIYFIGFDLSAEEALGARHDEPASLTPNNAGWFFCLQERPGEPRFGVDLPPPPDAAEPVVFDTWNALDWSRIGTAPGACVAIDKTLSLIHGAGSDPQDAQARWSPQTTAAELAYMLYQVPVLCAVHAHRMLPHV